MPYQPARRLRLAPDLSSRLARLHPPMSLRAFAVRADISYATLRGALNPEQQPQRNPKGGIYETTARKIARGFAQVAGITEDEAYAQLITESQRRYRRKPPTDGAARRAPDEVPA